LRNSYASDGIYRPGFVVWVRRVRNRALAKDDDNCTLGRWAMGPYVRIPHGRESTCHEVQSKCGDLDRARVVSAEPRHFLSQTTHKAPETQVANSLNSGLRTLLLVPSTWISLAALSKPQCLDHA